MVARDRGRKLVLRGELLWTNAEYRRTQAVAFALGLLVGSIVVGVLA